MIIVYNVYNVNNVMIITYFARYGNKQTNK